MWSRRGIRSLATAAVLACVLAGCSEFYFDRRDTVSLASGEAMAANRVTHTIDPWSAASGRRTIAYNGEKAAAASERYRTGRIIPPVNTTTSSLPYAPLPASAAPAAAPASPLSGNATK